MKIIKITFILFLILQINKIYSQGISEEYKQEVINSLAITTVDSIDTPHYGGNAIEAVIDYKIEEAIPGIIANIWKQDPYDQTRFIDALYFLGAEETEEIALAFLDSVDTYENTYFTKLELKLLAVQTLFYLGNYSKYQIVFDRIEESKPGLEYGAIFMLPYIIWNYPEHEERAKQELLKFAYESEEDIYKWYAVVNLDTVYGEEMVDVYINVLDGLESPSTRGSIIAEIFKKYKNSTIFNYLKDKLEVESNEYNRDDIGEQLLLNYGSPAIFKFVKDFQITDTTNLFLSMAVGTFRPIKPANSTVSTFTILDTLTSYTNQCYGYEWLKDEAYKAELLNKITNAKTKLNTGDSLGCRTEVASFQNSVNQVYQDSAGSYPKYISREGYKFLYYYAQYILDRLP